MKSKFKLWYSKKSNSIRFTEVVNNEFHGECWVLKPNINPLKYSIRGVIPEICP